MNDRQRLPPASLDARTCVNAGAPILFVPLGSTEQHGPHLPLKTDTAVAVAVAEALTERLRATGTDAAVAPALAYGASGEHQDFPGTISIGHSALTLLLIEYARSAGAWAKRVVFVNGHGGNLLSLADAVPRLRAEGHDVAWVPCAPLVGASPRDTHAGLVETSVMLHLHPADVVADRMTAGVSAPIADLLPRLRAEGVRAVSANGVLGDPRGAAADQGEVLFASMCDAAWARVRGERIAASGILALDAP